MRTMKFSSRKALAVALIAGGMVVAPLATAPAQATSCQDDLDGAACAALFTGLRITCKYARVGCLA